jgi:hypothetical protein
MHLESQRPRHGRVGRVFAAGVGAGAARRLRALLLPEGCRNVI